MLKRLMAFLVGGFALMAANSAGAHPHVWIDAKATLVFENGRITAIRMRWAFDPLFSMLVMGHHDKDKNKRIDKAESADIQANAFVNLKEHSYFTHLRLDGKPAKVSRVTGFKPMYSGDKLIYEFTVLLDRPIDPLKTRFGFGVYDDTYYVEIQFDEKAPVAVTGPGSAGCTHAIAVDKQNPFYNGIIFPRIASLRCAGS